MYKQTKKSYCCTQQWWTCYLYIYLPQSIYICSAFNGRKLDSGQSECHKTTLALLIVKNLRCDGKLADRFERNDFVNFFYYTYQKQKWLLFEPKTNIPCNPIRHANTICDKKNSKYLYHLLGIEKDTIRKECLRPREENIFSLTTKKSNYEKCDRSY